MIVRVLILKIKCVPNLSFSISSLPDSNILENAYFENSSFNIMEMAEKREK